MDNKKLKEILQEFRAPLPPARLKERLLASIQGLPEETEPLAQADGFQLWSPRWASLAFALSVGLSLVLGSVIGNQVSDAALYDASGSLAGSEWAD